MENLAKTLFHLVLILILYGCNDLSSKNSRIDFIKDNREELELTVNQILKGKWEIEKAQEFLTKKRINLRINEVNKEDMLVSFMIDGMLDNCIGIAYSGKGKEAHICGGTTVDWENLFDHWYFLNSI